MSERPLPNEELDRQLAELEENPAAPVDSTLRELYAELGTLALALRQSAQPDPYEVEPGCRRAVEKARALLGQLASSSMGTPATADETFDLPEGTQIGLYQVVATLGQGGMGAVFLAHDPQLDRQVALKLMLPKSAAEPAGRERFLREARLAASINHDHIVPIYHVGEHEGLPFVAMPVLKGENLAQLLKRRGRLHVGEAVRLGRQIAEGLAAAHEQGLIHRDIKPANIWVEPIGGGRVKILDFGLARMEQDDTHLTQSGAILGTPAYMSPEQARSQNVDARTDLWSLGAVLYELVAGRRPFGGGTAMAVLSSIFADQPAPPSEVQTGLPAELSDLVMRLLEKDPDKRPASAREVVDALAAIQRELEPPLERQSVEPSPSANNQEMCSTILAKTKHFATCPETDQRASAVPKAASPRRSWGGRGGLVAAAIALAVMGPLAYFFGGTLIRIATNQGELVVEVDDPKVEIKVVQNGVVVQDKTKQREFTLTAGKGQVQVFETDGIKLATKEFVLTRGGKTTVRVTLEELAAARPSTSPLPQPEGPGVSDPDRRAAEYVLSIGGIIRINGREEDLRAAAELPKEPFRLNYVHLGGNKQVTDAGLAHFKDCRNLRTLTLNGCEHVTDAGLAHFKDCDELAILDLRYTQVTDAGLAYFQGCRNLSNLSVNSPHVTDAGLAYFKDCKNLQVLILWYTRVTDAGLAHFKDCKNLTELHLASTQVTDAGLAHFMDCKNLRYLDLQGTRVTDLSVPWIAAQQGGDQLRLTNTRISHRGYEELKAVHLTWTITWSENNHELAQAVLKLGGKVEIATPGEAEARPVREADELIRDYFQVRRISLAGLKQPLGDLPTLISQLRDPQFDRLVSLDLSGTNLPDLVFLDGVAGIEELVLAGTSLKDVSLGRLPKLPALRRLVLDGNDIRGAGLRHLANSQPQLQELSVNCPSIDAAAALQLPGLKALKRLSLVGANLSDAGIQPLESLTSLEQLDLRQTKVTAEGIARLQKALPNCEITWDGK